MLWLVEYAQVNASKIKYVSYLLGILFEYLRHVLLHTLIDMIHKYLQRVVHLEIVMTAWISPAMLYWMTETVSNVLQATLSMKI